MPTIDTDIARKVIAVLLAETAITDQLASNTAGKMIRAGKAQLIGDKYPQITVFYTDGKSDSIFPACEGELNITIWVKDTHREPISFLSGIKDLILALFNRQGSDYNDIDVPTNTGLRVLQFVNRVSEYGVDDVVKDIYWELIFDVNRSNGESFLASDAGNKTWV